MENAKESFVIASSSSSTRMDGASNNNNLNNKGSFENKQINGANNDFTNSATCAISNNCKSNYNQCNDKNHKLQIMENVSHNNNTECDTTIKKTTAKTSTENSITTSFHESNENVNASNCFTGNLVASSSTSLPLSLKAHNLKGLHKRTNIINQLSSITLNISTTMGQEFSVTVNPTINVENLKKIIAKKFKMTKDRISLLHREKELQKGSLLENNIIESSKITVTPNCESGRRIRRPENTLLQALESLSESQLDDILSGKMPLIINMRLGEHVMLIQLQLTCKNGKHVLTKSHGGYKPSPRLLSEGRNRSRHNRRHYYRQQQYRSRMGATSSSSCAQQTTILSSRQKPTTTIQTSANNNNINSNENNNNNNMVTALPSMLHENDDQISKTSLLLKCPNHEVLSVPLDSGQNVTSTTIPDNFSPIIDPVKILEQSPIKSLTNLITNSMKTTAEAETQTCSFVQLNVNCVNTATSINKSITTIATSKESKERLSASNTDSIPSTSTYCDPIAANLTSCLCTSLCHGNNALNVLPLKNKCDIDHTKKQQQHQNECINIKDYNTASSMVDFSPPQVEVETCEATKNLKCQCDRNHLRQDVKDNIEIKPTPTISMSKPMSSNSNEDDNNITFNCKSHNDNNDSFCVSKSMQNVATTNNGLILNATTTSLSEASKNLKSTLKNLSKDVRINKATISSLIDRTPKYASQSGAVIESIKNYNKNIYSGKFSGKLNAILREPYGRPKRDIFPLLNVLDHLITAAPQISRNVTSLLHTENASARNSSTNKQVNENLDVAHAINALPSSSAVSDISSKLSNGKTGLYFRTDKQTFKKNDKNNSTICQSNTNDLNDCKPLACTCPHCINLKTKYKMEQIRLVMQQRKEKRLERKMKSAPYTIKTTTVATPSISITSAETVTIDCTNNTINLNAATKKH